jgi:hypothetical protein
VTRPDASEPYGSYPLTTHGLIGRSAHDSILFSSANLCFIEWRARTQPEGA